MAFDKFCRKIISRSEEWTERKNGFNSRTGKKHMVRQVRFKLECGHTMVRIAREGTIPRHKKFVHCDWCESGEEPQ